MVTLSLLASFRDNGLQDKDPEWTAWKLALTRTPDDNRPTYDAESWPYNCPRLHEAGFWP